MNIGFQFKQFFVRHDRCAMKVGTDGVLLGAWAPTSKLKIKNAKLRILDIGTGSGLIAMMLAQRCPEAQIDAIDIDPEAVDQARENFQNSPWPDRLHASHCALQDLSDSAFNLIVSNPPYFVDSLKAPDAARCAARHNDTLPFATLIEESARRLNPDGTLAVIVPCDAEQELQTLAAAHGLQCTHRCYVQPKPGRPAKRVLLAWQQSLFFEQSGLYSMSEAVCEHLTLEDDHGGRSDEYKQLTKDFYL